MDISALSSISNRTSLPLGKEKEIHVSQHKRGRTVIQNRLINLYRAQLLLTGGLTVGTGNNEGTEDSISSQLPKCHRYPILTMLSARGSRKLLESKALLVGGGGPHFRLTLKPLSVIALLHHLASTAAWDDTSLAANYGFYITVICSSVLKCSGIFIQITYLLNSFMWKPQTYLSHPWWNLAISFTWPLHVPLHLLPVLFLTAPYINTYSVVFRK